MPKRKPARPGLSYYDANKDRLVSFDDDVLGIKKEILDRWPELDVFFDQVDEVWVVIEHCKDKDRLLTTTAYLDRRIIRRIEDADDYARKDDVLDLVDAYNENLEKENDRVFSEKIGDAGERLIHAMRKDGLICAPRVFIAKELTSR